MGLFDDFNDDESRRDAKEEEVLCSCASFSICYYSGCVGIDTAAYREYAEGSSNTGFVMLSNASILVADGCVLYPSQPKQLGHF